MVINLEVARYALATGETAYTGYARLWRGFAIVFVLLNLTSWLLPGWARSCGVALRALVLGPRVTPLEGGPDWVWTALAFFVVALMLFGPKVIYRSVERWTSLMVVVAIVGLVSLAVLLGRSDLWLAVAKGAVNLGHKEPAVSYPLFFSWLVFAGAGGTANLFFCFYLRDKNMGMGGRIPALTNILRDREPRESLTGYRFPDDAENRSRWRCWWLHAVREQVLFFWFLNSLTILLFIFASLAVVYPLTQSGVVQWEGLRAFYEGKEISLLALEAVALGNVFAPLTTLFLLVAVATLLSTQLTLVDGVARSLSRHRPHEFRRGSKATPRFLVCGGGRCVDSPRLFSDLRIGIQYPGSELPVLDRLLRRDRDGDLLSLDPGDEPAFPSGGRDARTVDDDADGFDQPFLHRLRGLLCADPSSGLARSCLLT